MTASIHPVLKDAYPSEWPLRWASSASLDTERGELMAEIWKTLAKPNPHAKKFDLKITLTLATPREERQAIPFIGVPITDVNRRLGREVEDGRWAD